MDTPTEEKCCPGGIHIQIQYVNVNGMPIESLISTQDPATSENRAFLHALLDEWIDRRVPHQMKFCSDHFIVYGKWPDGGSHT